MARITPLSIEQADESTAATLTTVKQNLGMLPNLFGTFAHAPAVLNSYLGFRQNLSEGLLSERQREIIALAVAQSSQCQYCLSAHTLLGKRAGLSDDEILAARNASASDETDNAIAVLALQLASQQGWLKDEQFEAAKAGGLEQGHIVEVTANVAFNLLTNYVNHVAQTDVDFPKVEV